MRILVFTDEYDASLYTFIYNEIKALEGKGITVQVVCERIGKLAPTDKNFELVPFPKNKWAEKIYLQAYKLKWFFLLSWYPFFKKRKAAIHQFKPDIIHFHFGDTAVKLYRPLAKILQQHPCVVSFHGFDASYLLHIPQYFDRLKKLMARPNYFWIYVSNQLRKNLEEKGIQLDKKKSALLYYGINLQQFRRTNYVNNDIKIFLQISTFFEKKGHVYTLEAFKIFLQHHPGQARLVLGGDGPLRNEIINHARELGLSDWVDFPGWISREAAVLNMNEADYFVHHSITAANGDQEGIPNAIIEAMAMELPILTTFHSGIPELVENGVNGFLVAEKHIENYAAKMGEIFHWSFLPHNRRKVERQFSIQTHTDNLLNIYQNVRDSFNQEVVNH